MWKAILLLAVSTLARVVLTELAPFDGDEAYYLSWGLNPKWMYVDHPPVIGWTHALNRLLWDQPTNLSLRLPWVLMMTSMGVTLILMSRTPFQTSVLFNFHPLTLIPFLRPDHWVALSLILGAFYWHRRYLSTALILLAPCSKYLGVLALIGSFPFVDTNRKKLWVIGSLFVGALILWANAQIGWKNLEFTFFTRFEKTGTQVGGIFHWLASVMLYIGPIGLLSIQQSHDERVKFLKHAACGSILILGLIALSGRYQHTWMLASALVMLGAMSLAPGSNPQLVRIIVTCQCVSSLALISCAYALHSGAIDPWLKARGESSYRAIVYTHPRDFFRSLQHKFRHEGKEAYPWVFEGYAEASLAAVFLGSTVHVLPLGSAWFREMQENANNSASLQKNFIYFPLGMSLPSSVLPICTGLWRRISWQFNGFDVPLFECSASGSHSVRRRAWELGSGRVRIASK